MSNNITAFSKKAVYRVERYTDNLAGNINRLVPVLDTGERDPRRAESFSGDCILYTNRGPMPITFEIKATSLDEAMDNFAVAIADKLEEIKSKAVQAQIMSGIGQSPSKLIKP